MPPLALHPISVAATYRLVRLAIEDTIFDEPREAVYAWCARGGAFRQWFLALITCPWCLGVWMSGFVTLAVWRVHRPWNPVVAFLWWMSVAAVQPWMHMVEGIVLHVGEMLEEQAE